MSNHNELAAVFQKTTYKILLSNHAYLDFHFHQLNEDFNAWLTIQGIESWAFLTPCNPNSTQVPEIQNKNNLIKLEEKLKNLQMGYYSALHKADNQNWPDEPSFLLINVSLDSVQELSEEYHQSAFIYGQSGSEPEIIFYRG